jgi:hypothetical protein
LLYLLQGFSEILVWSFGLRFLGKTELAIVEGGDFDLNYARYDNQANTNSNVLLSSWGSFVISLLLVTSWWKASTTTRDWVLLTAVSIAMMVSSYFAYETEVSVNQNDRDYTTTRICTLLRNYSCNRILYGQYLGLASGVISLIMIAMTRVPVIVHVIVSALLFIGWAVGVSMIAFGSGHGTRAGDVFMEVWACVFLSLDILTTNIAIFVRTKEHGSEISDPVDNQSETPTRNIASQEQSAEQHANEPKDIIDPLNIMPQIAEAPDAMNV